MSWSAALDILIEGVDRAYDRTSWHGPNLRASLRGVTAEMAIWRAGSRRKCIAEIALHTAYWKYAGRRILTGEKRGSFPLAGSNWFARAAPYSQRDWKADIALVDEVHRAWRAVVATIDPGRLSRRAKGSFTVAGLIQGVAAHDLYHAGQIQLVRRMQSD
jgi:hypothetical protein